MTVGGRTVRWRRLMDEEREAFESARTVNQKPQDPPSARTLRATGLLPLQAY